MIEHNESDDAKRAKRGELGSETKIDKTTKEYKNAYRKRYYDTHKDNIIKIAIRSQKKAKEYGRFRCEEHNISYPNNSRLQRHLNGYKHNSDRYITYKCDLCIFSSKQKFHYDKHINTMKHKYNIILKTNSNLIIRYDLLS